MTQPVQFEAARIAALSRYEIMDTPREPAFDEIVDLLAEACEAPIAVINFAAREMQFFKAEVGLGVDSTPLATSFCAHVLLEEEFLVVPDTTLDPRFDCNPLVTAAPHIRFYAGALLKTAEGFPIGTLCVLDYHPRTLTDLQHRTIRVLARQVMAQLDQRLNLARAERAEAWHRAIVDSARDFAVVALDLEGTIIEWSQGAERIMGWSEAEALGREASLFFTPEDREAGRPALEMREARQHGKANDERWHLRKGGGRFWASGDMSPLTDRSGTHIGYRRTAFSVSDYMDHTASGPAFLECRMVMRTKPFAMEAFATRVRKMTKC